LHGRCRAGRRWWHDELGYGSIQPVTGFLGNLWQAAVVKTIELFAQHREAASGSQVELNDLPGDRRIFGFMAMVNDT
jgi:hypothetical protein